MKKIKVGLFNALDMLEFKSMKEDREKVIENTKPIDIDGQFLINKHAEEMHPEIQELIVEKIIEHPEAKAKSYILSSINKNGVAYFRAGQVISLKLQIGDSFVTRPYSISSSPKDASKGKYRITIKEKENGFVSKYILNNFEVGTRVLTSAPYGNFYYESFRDNINVVGIAGGSSITPFVSMANAIKDEIEDFNLTIIYGNNDSKSILFKDELDSIQKRCKKVKVIYVLANEQKKGYEYGLITSSIISKYIDNPYSIFISGSFEMQEYLKKELSSLRKKQKEIRYDTSLIDDDITKRFNYPKESIGKIYKIKVIQGPSERIIDANSNESLLVAFERAGIKVPSICRGGDCGWCRSKLLIGNIYYAKRKDQRRYVDIEFNYIHPCCCYPVDDCTIEIPSEYI